MSNLKKIYDEYKGIKDQLPQSLKNYLLEILWAEMAFNFKTKSVKKVKVKPLPKKISNPRRKFSEVISESKNAE